MKKLLLVLLLPLFLSCVGFTYTYGRSYHRETHWVFIGGYWVEQQMIWVPGHWERHGRHSHWVSGHYE